MEWLDNENSFKLVVYDIQFSDTGDFLQKAAANIRSYYEEYWPEEILTINLEITLDTGEKIIIGADEA